MDKSMTTIRELTSAELDAVGGGGGTVSVNAGKILKGLDKLGNQIEADASKFLSSVEKQVGGFLGGLF